TIDRPDDVADESARPRSARKPRAAREAPADAGSYNEAVSATDLPEPRILARSEHPVSRSLIDKNALKVLYRLQSAGYKAYLVGGGVRDLMLGRKPKDFDVATDARPNEIRRVF